ncbi:hypothetical protein M9H77_22370 [Catharanthus roseus]|uniref:Uncharacterized protein n=1 Tax=Catharanthus roseus TaxID=4058 RepID=A0ACC0ASV0_CATRO|nr:hypothetical protein M9H77_22370 [Catharanthus roseus]
MYRFEDVLSIVISIVLRKSVSVYREFEVVLADMVSILSSVIAIPPCLFDLIVSLLNSAGFHFFHRINVPLECKCLKASQNKGLRSRKRRKTEKKTKSLKLENV